MSIGSKIIKGGLLGRFNFRINSNLGSAESNQISTAGYSVNISWIDEESTSGAVSYLCDLCDIFDLCDLFELCDFTLQGIPELTTGLGSKCKLLFSCTCAVACS